MHHKKIRDMYNIENSVYLCVKFPKPTIFTSSCQLLICQFTQCLIFYNVLLQQFVLYIWYIITGIAHLSYNGKNGYNINLCSVLCIVSSYFLRLYNDWVLTRMNKRV